MTRNEEKANVLAEHLAIKNGKIVNSGTIALLSALKVANIKPGDNVLINGYCCYSLFEAIMNVGANPIFVIPKDFYNISVDEIRKVLNENEIKYDQNIIFYFGNETNPYSIELINNATIYNNTDININNTQNYVEVEQLTEDDIITILTNLQNQIEGTVFQSLFELFIKSTY